MTTATIIKGATFEGSNLGNIFGLPPLPAGVQFAHLLRGDKDYAGRNIGRLVAGQTGNVLTEISPATLAYDATSVVVSANDKGWQSPYLVPESFTWVYVLKDQAYAAFALTNNRASGAPLTDGAQGVQFYSVEDVTGYGYFRAAHWDGVSGSATMVTCERSGLFGILSAGQWAMGVARYNAATKELAAFRCYDKQVSRLVLPAGQVLDRRGWDAAPIRISGSVGQSDSTLRTHRAALAMGWSVALTDGEILDVVYPRLKAFLVTRGIEVS